MKKTTIKIIKKLIGIAIFIIILLAIKFNPVVNNIVNSGIIVLFHNKVIHEFANEDIDYLEKEVFEFEITDYGDITAGELIMGRDGGILIEVSNIENVEEFKDSIIDESGSTLHSMHYIRKFINGVEGECEDTVYYIKHHRKHVYIYKQDNKVNVEILSEYITDEVYDILNIPVIDKYQQ